MSDLIKEVLMGKLFGSGTGSGGSSGGGGGASSGVSPKEVNFYDYDGTCVYAYSVAEAQALSELPAGQEHPGLVFQGWNWSLEGVKGLTRAMNIGAMYTTDDGTTRLYITLQEGRTSPMLGVGVNGTVTVDWGDGTEPDVLTGTSTSTTVWTPNHAYAKPGDYVIRLTVDGEMGFRGSDTVNQHACILRYASGTDARNKTYLCALTRLEIGENVRSIRSQAFWMCRSLASLTIPDGVSVNGDDVFKACSTLASVVFPNGVTIIGEDSFYGCDALTPVVMPGSVVEIKNYAYRECSTLASVAIPNGVTIIGAAFYGCTALTSVVMPGSVVEIGVYAFNGCTGVSYYDFTAHTAVPTLTNTNAFTGIPDDCEIRVPASLYDEWIAATNWATYADYIKAY